MRAVVVEQRLFLRQHGHHPVAAGFKPRLSLPYAWSIAGAVRLLGSLGQHRLVRVGEIRVR